MKLKVIGSNMTEVETDKATILFSYSTPVAAFSHDGKGYFKTNKKYSVTTTKHINKWLAGIPAKEVDQGFFDQLV